MSAVYRGKFITQHAQQHILDLASAFKIQIVWTDDIINSHAIGNAARPWDGKREVHIALTTSDFVYAVNLHELGHLIHPGGILSPNHVFNMEQELNAWNWAEQQALCWTEQMELAKSHGLKTHSQGDALRDIDKGLLHIVETMLGGVLSSPRPNSSPPAEPRQPLPPGRRVMTEDERLKALREFGKKLK